MKYAFTLFCLLLCYYQATAHRNSTTHNPSKFQDILRIRLSQSSGMSQQEVHDYGTAILQGLNIDNVAPNSTECFDSFHNFSYNSYPNYI